MEDGSIGSDGRLSRRSMLAGTAATLTASTSGCIRQVRSTVSRDTVPQLSVTISTVPADSDRQAVQLARRLAGTLESVGIDVSISLLADEELIRRVAINHDFDVFVGRFPGRTDPDFLYEALHSRFVDESGWQNPFGFANMSVDGFLEEQRTLEGDERREAVFDALEAVAAEQPFVPICRPREIRLARTDRFRGWQNGHLEDRLGYLGLEVVDEATDGDENARIRGIVIDPRPSKNLNPLSIEYRNRGTLINLLYDSLAASDEGSLLPWLAAEWEWDGSTVEVTLRDGHEFHDGEPVTASDVAFTYEFLGDTALGGEESPSPTPFRRGAVSAIEEVEIHDDLTLSMSVSTSPEVAEQAFTVPILPAHVWEGRAESASVPGVRTAQGTTEALVSDNVPPVGSGPFRFVERVEREYVLLERFDEHFTRRPDVDLPEPTAGSLEARIDPRSTSAITIVQNGDADVTISTLDANVVDDIEPPDDVSLLESRSRTFYSFGFNARRAPFSNPNFRRVVARAIDKEWLVADVFDGYADPIATPVIADWTPPSLEWDGIDPVVPFAGDDGEVNTTMIRTLFEEAGFRYGEDERLLVRR